MLNSKLPQKFDVDNKGKTPLFVYSTLMNPKTLEHVEKHKAHIRHAFVWGMIKCFYKTPEGTRFATLEPLDSNIREGTKGHIIEVTNEDLNKLKTWEDEYTLKPIKLSDGTNAMFFDLKKTDKLQKE